MAARADDCRAHRRARPGGAATDGSFGPAARTRAARRGRGSVPARSDDRRRRSRPARRPPDGRGHRQLSPYGRHDRHAEACGTQPRQRGFQRLDDARQQRPRREQRDFRRVAAVPHQRAVGDRSGAIAQGPARRLGRPARLPRPPAVPELLEDRRALPDRGDVRRPHGLFGARADSSRRRHLQPEAADRGSRSTATRGARRVRGPDRRRAVRGLRTYGRDVRQCTQLAGGAAARHGRAAAPLPGGPHRRDRRADRHLDLPGRERDRDAGVARPEHLRRLPRSIRAPGASCARTGRSRTAGSTPATSRPSTATASSVSPGARRT